MFNVKNVTPQKRAGWCVQCEQCEALKKEIRRSAEAIPPEICGAFAAEFCGGVLRRFCGAFCGKPLKTKTGQDEKRTLTCSNAVVPPAGFEPAISTLKGWRPWPLDDGDSGKEYSRLFCRRVYRWQTGKPPQRSRLLFRFSNISICNIWAGKLALSVTDRDKRQASGRTSHSVTVRRLLTV